MARAANPPDDLPLFRGLLAEILDEFPRFRIVPKAGDRFSRVVDVALRIVTAGGQRSYLTRYHTVMGSTLYVPPSWDRMTDADRVILLRHERVHLRQSRRFGFGLMAFLYLVPFFPLGLAYGRARLEWEAYEETLRATAEHYGIAAVKSAALRDGIVTRFTGPDYGWMWPFRRSVERWYDDAVERIERRAS
ncbi:MAG TPA: hypothetical protein VH142_12515 [Polyangiaceae bacterium]|nr:hypothetical protein [Polyangiaceae bacterium]